MKFTKKILIGFAVTAFTFSSYAQDANSGDYQSLFGGSSSSSVSASPAVATQSASAGNTQTSNTEAVLPAENSLRGAGYYATVAANPAGLNSVADGIMRPAIFNGKKVVMVEPGNTSSGQGLIVFPAMNGSFFLHMRSDASIGAPDRANALLTSGIALNNIGFGLQLGFDKTRTNNKPTTGSETTITNTNAFDNLGLIFSTKNASNEMYGSLNWLSTGNENKTATNTTNTVDVDAITLGFGIRNETIASKSKAMDAGVLFRYSTDATKTGGTTTVRDSTYLGLSLPVSFGVQLKNTSDLRILFGATSSLAFRLFADQNASATKSPGFEGKWDAQLNLAPNFSAEMALTKNWSLLGGISELLNLGYESQTDNQFAGGNLSKAGSSSALSLLNAQTNVNTGIRFSYGAFGAEAMLAAKVWDDGISSIFSNTNVLGNTSLFWNF